MKIALVLAQPPGYSETFFNSKIKGLQENGHEVTLFTSSSQETYTLCKHVKSPKLNRFFLIQIFKMIWIGFLLLSNIRAVSKYFKLEKSKGNSSRRILEKIYLNAQLLKFKGDWIHFGFATLALNKEFVAEAIDAKMAVSFRGFDINVYPLKHPGCYDLLWQQVDKVQSISQYLLVKANSLGLSKETPSKIITPAVNIKTLPKRIVNEVENKLTIITIARFNWMKGIDYLIEVAAHLKNEGLDFEWQLIGAGTNSDKEKYLYHIYEKGLDQHVMLKGKYSHDETLNILATADIYVQPSVNEGFCNAVLEAQALGIPSVVFKVGGLQENILDTKTGWLIEPFDVVAMAKRIINITSLTHEEKVKISEQAVSRVQEQFNLNHQKHAFHIFYTQ
ncbi:glycosyltransferase family 4 protein [Psychroserpens damuponensis]|uniref:glycosyltransferase family 4 protein n=1 Tax=Psychroserpens damuponensis TaxID=943936 RepID=UPI0005900192|nr:glycosyltransferase family 4 protein [Psychroserpens damuponensis]